MYYLLAGLIAGFFVGSMWARRGNKALQEQLGAKRASWCADCATIELFNGARETLQRNAKSISALGGVVNSQVYEIKRLKRALQKANIDAGASYFDLNVAR